MDFATFLIQLLNSVQYGLLLFMLAAGLTLIFGIMGVVNLAHGSFYMLGAYLGYSLSGYFGSVANGEAFAGWLEAHRNAGAGPRYVLDPVIGDTHTGAYVEPGLETVFAERLLPLAWMVTPNAFELGRLTGRAALQEADALVAARALLERGPEWVLAHSVAGEGGDLVTLMVGRDAAWRIRSSRLDVDVAGTGDVLAALLATFLLRGEPPQRAAERALAGVHAALESTLANGWEELDVLAAPAAALAEVPRFQAVPV